MSVPSLQGQTRVTIYETNSGLDAMRVLQVVDAEPADTVRVEVRRVEIGAGSTFQGTVPLGFGRLHSMMTLEPAAVPADPPDGSAVTWHFASGDEGHQAFDFLGHDQTLILDYLLKASDDAVDTHVSTRVVKVTIVGHNDAPYLVGHAVHATLIEGDAALAATGTLVVVDPDLDDSVQISVRPD
jgi:hypothetical protein